MNRRSFLSAIAGLPFLGFLKPKAKPSGKRTICLTGRWRTVEFTGHRCLQPLYFGFSHQQSLNLQQLLHARACIYADVRSGAMGADVADGLLRDLTLVWRS